MKIVLKHINKDSWYKKWTVKGPSFTKNVEEAMQFDNVDDAKFELSRDYRLMAYKPKLFTEKKARTSEVG